jgi:hypothetical protein
MFQQLPVQYVESPCIRKCTLDDNDICVGCFRSLDEICAWGGASNTQRHQIITQAIVRRKEQTGNV